MAKRILVSAFIIFLIMLPDKGITAPLITSVKGPFTDGNEILITGANFGDTGPHVLLFDNFSRGNQGEKFTTNAVIGMWAKMPSIAFDDPMLSNQRGARCFNENGWLNANLFVFGKTYSEVFISSIAYVPEGYYFPSNKGQGENSWPNTSCLKHFWFYYTPTGYKTDNNPDLVGVCVNSSTSIYKLFANDYVRATLDRTDEVQWVWHKPVRWTLWVKGNGTQRVGSDGLFQAVSPAGQTYKRYKDSFAWFAESDNVYGFDRVTVPGFLVSGPGDRDANYVVDDVYLAAGPGAAARVEIGNSPSYTSCTKLAISTPVAWSQNEIRAIIREGTFRPGEKVYIFVTDRSGDNSEGYGPLTFGEKIEDESPQKINDFRRE